MSNTAIGRNTSESVFVLLGSNVTLPCQNGVNSTNKRKIWKFNEKILFSGNDKFAPKELDIIKITDDGDLFIPHFEYDYEGSYTCRLGAGPAIQQYIVSVEGTVIFFSLSICDHSRTAFSITAGPHLRSQQDRIFDHSRIALTYLPVSCSISSSRGHFLILSLHLHAACFSLGLFYGFCLDIGADVFV